MWSFKVNDRNKPQQQQQKTQRSMRKIYKRSERLTQKKPARLNPSTLTMKV